MSRKTSSKNKTHVSMTSSRIETLRSKPLSDEDKMRTAVLADNLIKFGVLNGRQNSLLTRIENKYAS